MKITIKLMGFLAHTSQGRKFRSGLIELPDDANLEDALAYAGVPSSTPLMITVNGTLAKRGQSLQDGDVVNLIPPISGG